MHIGVFLIQSASFIHQVCRCASLSTTFALSQSMTWFSSTVTRHGLCYTALPCPGGSGLCTCCERVHFFLVFLDPQTELPACLSSSSYIGELDVASGINGVNVVRKLPHLTLLYQFQNIVHIPLPDFQVTCSIEL